MRKTIGFILLILLVTSSGVAGYGYYKYKQMTEQWFEPIQQAEKDESEEAEQKAKLKKDNASTNMEPFTALILGVDARNEKKTRSDTMMFAAIHPTLKEVKILSIPRDTLAEIPGYGSDKFNHAMFYGGPPLVKKTVQQFFDMEVDRYITIDFEGFVKLVDELGGIDVEVKRRMKYSDPSDGTKIDLYPGKQRLNGKEALDYARFRKSEIGSDASDFDRMERQQEVVKQLAKKANRISTVLHVFNLMTILGEHVKTDLTIDEIRTLAVIFKDDVSSNIETVQLKGSGRRLPKHGYHLWFYVVDEDERNRIKQIFSDTIEDDMEAIEPS